MYNKLNYWHNYWHIYRGVTLTICWIRASQQKVKYHNRRLNFRFHMRNKKNQNNMCDIMRDLQTTTFSQTPPSPGAWSTLCTAVYIYNTPFSDSEALRPYYSAHAGCYSPIQELCLCWPLRLDTPCTWNYYPCHLSSRGDCPDCPVC